MMQKNNLIEFMGIVGGGARVSKDLTHEQARDAMNALLDGAYHPVTFGSFTLAMRWKPETAEEMAGFADAMNGRIVNPQDNAVIPGLVSSAGAYDGKVRTVNFEIAAAITAAAAGVPSLLHGSENIPAKRGMTPFHILKKLGWNPLRGVDEVKLDLQQNRFGYLHQTVVNPILCGLIDDRQQVGKRTFINSIEPLINPYQASVHIGGFFHRSFGELMSNATARMQTGWQRTLMVAGIEGSEEIKPGRSFVVEWRNGEMKSFYIEPKDYGIVVSDEDAASNFGGDIDAMADESAGLIQAYLQQSAPEPYRDMVLLNAGLRIYAAGKANEIEEGYRIAQETYNSGLELEMPG